MTPQLPFRGRMAKTPLLLVAAFITALALSSCSSGSDSLDSLSPSAREQAGGAGSSGDFVGAPADAGKRDAAGQLRNEATDGSLEPAGQSFIKTGSVSLHSKDVEATVNQIKAITASAGGVLANEYSDTGDDGKTTSSEIVVRVPVDAFDATYTKFGQLATRKHAEQSSVNVTAEVADVDSRVESAKRVINRLRDLYSRADTLGAIIQLEGELAARESDLEALQAQQKALHDQSDLSTISVSVTEPPTSTANAEDRSGFIGGITRGWDGLVTLLSGTMTVVGLVLPFAVLFLIVGAVVYFVVRHVTPRRAPEPSE